MHVIGNTVITVYLKCKVGIFNDSFYENIY